MIAAMIPPVTGTLSPVTVILWSLLGDPPSRLEAFGGLALGVAWLGAYTVLGYAVLTGLGVIITRGMRR
jgi:hypothetical protein